MKNYLYEAKITDEETGEIIIRVSSSSQEGLEEEMGKSKWTEAIKKYEELELEAEDIMESTDSLEEKENQLNQLN
jgi:hypothetical protein